MDASTPLGIIVAIICIVIAFTMDGGTVTALISETAALIVFGGTIGAVMASHTMNEVLGIPRLIIKAMKKEKNNMVEIIQYLVTLSKKARSQGLLSLEGETHSENLNKFDPIMKDCLELAVDGTEAELLSCPPWPIEKMPVSLKLQEDMPLRWGLLVPLWG